jgi:hypothetical protein
MYKFFSVMLVACAISTPAHADVFGFLSSTSGPEQIVDGQVHAPTQNGVVDGSMHGYPFYSGCCESDSSYGKGLWDGYCGGKGCGMKAPRVRHHGGLKGGCGSDACCGMGYGHSPCAYGGCGGFGGKARFGGYLSYRGMGGKGGCEIGSPCGGKGCDTCDPCAPKHHCRLGLFNWMHFSHGHGCDVCGDSGCSSCDGGKGGFGKGGYMEYAPAQDSGESQHGAPTEAQENSLQPPEVLVEPTSISDRSAWRRQLPTNPFTRPLGY